MKGLKKVLIIIGVFFAAFVVLAIAGAVIESKDGGEEATTEAAVEVTTEVATQVATEDASTAETESAEDAKKDTQKEVEDKYGLMKLADPQNDSTGLWHVAGYTAAVQPQEVALDYYNAFFGSDDETHGLWSAAYNTMSSVRRMGDVLDVTVRQYNKGEEHYAQQLFGGDVYAEYWVHIDTGEIEKIGENE